jgi:hypothetical protein
LVLVNGDPPKGMSGAVGVAVSSDRAEAPGAVEWDRSIADLGERLMLGGLKHLRVIGAPARWHGVMRSRLDQRVTLQFQALSALNEDNADAALAGTDVLWLWGVSVNDAVLPRLEGSATLVSRSSAAPTAALASLLRALNPRTLAE